MTSRIWEVSSSIRCDWIWRGSRFRTRHFGLAPTSCCCASVVSVPVAALGGVTVSPTLVLWHGALCHHQLHPVRQQPLGCVLHCHQGGTEPPGVTPGC